jgi:hypothetical protein
VKGIRGQSVRSNGLRPGRTGHVPRWAPMLLLGLSMTGCALRQPPPTPAAAPASCMAEQSEIERLQQLLAEKDALIRSQQAHQQEQAKELQSTTSQATRAQVKLSRMATQTDAASTLAEVEVAMAALKSAKTTAPQQAMQAQAQHLLEAASAAYAIADFVTAVDRASQAREIIDMVQAQRNEKAANRHSATVAFQTPIPLRTRIDCNLRQLPRGNAALLTVLKKDATLLGLAYNGDWLQVQTEDGRMGWLLNSLVSARAGEP